MKKLTKKEIDKSLKYSIAEGSANSIKDGIEGNYIIPFALLLGATNEFIGILTSLPEMFGIFVQTISSKLIKKTKSKKLANRITKFIGNLFWIPIILIPLLFSNGLLWLLLFLCIRVAFSQIDDTIWCSWMADIVPNRIRGSFFGKRNMFLNTFSFIASLLAGWFLGIVHNLYGFMIIFSIAFSVNFISIYLIGKISEMPYSHNHKKRFSFKHFIYGIKNHSNYSNFVLYRTIMNFSIHISAPFWIVYVLKNMNIGYFWYAVAIGVYMIVNIISQRYWGKMIDVFGEKKIMFVCAFMLPFTALMMIFITSVSTLMIERIFAGFAFSGFHLASFNYLLSASPQEDSPTFIANYKVFAGFGASLGPLVGGFLAAFFADKIIVGLGALQMLFLIAFVLRLSTTSFMLTRLHSLRVRKRIAFRNVFLKTTVIYPVYGMLHSSEYLIHSIHRWEHTFKSRLNHK